MLQNVEKMNATPTIRRALFRLSLRQLLPKKAEKVFGVKKSPFFFLEPILGGEGPIFSPGSRILLKSHFSLIPCRKVPDICCNISNENYFFF